MKKEQFFRLLGDLDDGILEQYRQMDAQLSQKMLRKKRAMRAIIIAACLALLIGACVPVGMMVYPAGNAMLTEQLNKIDGFKPWQERTAENLEQTLSNPMWKLLQSMPVLNVLTQSQYPDYAFKSMRYGEYLNAPEYLTYGFADSVGDYFPDRVDIDVYGEKYQDFNAPGTCPPPPGSSLEEGQVLPYRYSMPQTLYTQTVHVYELSVDKVRYTVYVDTQTGECVYWEIIKASSYSPTVADEQAMANNAYDILVQNVRDPEAYTLRTERNDHYFVCRYSRCIGDFDSYDCLTVRFDLAGNIVSVDMAYLGALRYLTEIPQDLVDQIEEYMNMEVAEAISSETQIGKITILPDGRIALDCYMKVVFYDEKSEMGFSDATWFLACLTEPTDEYEDVKSVTTADTVTTEPVTTEPVTTEPVTTEPVTTEPVTTQPPRETESNWDINDVPKLVKMGYLQISVRDEDGTVTSLLSPEELRNFSGEVDVEYKPGRMLVIEGYAGYNRNGQVRYRCFDKNVTGEWIDYSEIETSLTIDVDADYIHCFRYTVPLDQYKAGKHGLDLVGDATGAQIEGFAMWENFVFYLNKITE